MDCMICFMPYTNIYVIQCGSMSSAGESIHHTICVECASTLRKNAANGTIKCPQCRRDEILTEAQRNALKMCETCTTTSRKCKWPMGCDKKVCRTCGMCESHFESVM